MDKLLIYGSGGHGLSTYSLVRDTNIYDLIGFIDDFSEVGENVVDEFEVLGSFETLMAMSRSIKIAIGVGSTGDLSARSRLIEKLTSNGFAMPALVSPKSFIDRNCKIGEGSQIHTGAILRFGANLGRGVLVNSGALIEHESTVGDFSVISPRATVCGKVSIGQRTFIGASTTILQNLKIGSDCLIGAHTLVRSDVGDAARIVGMN
jgi:UDP-perosamine 4-acetyltransferase